MLQNWRATLDIDIAHEMRRLTFNIILDTVLSGAEDFDRAAMAGRIDGLFRRIARLRLSYVLAPDSHHERRASVPTPERAGLVADIGRMLARRRMAPPRGDLVDLLIGARDPETGEPLSDALSTTSSDSSSPGMRRPPPP